MRCLKDIAINTIEGIGAQERTRTSTSIRTLAPEASASTNSATWAGVVKSELNLRKITVNSIHQRNATNARRFAIPAL